MQDERRATIKPLTSIRGLAAVWVYIFHCSNHGTDSAFLKAFATHGGFGVDIFFILSGFIISYVHLDEFTHWQGLKKNLKPFLCLRLARIYPLHLIAMILFIATMPVLLLEGRPPEAMDGVLNLLLMQSWTFHRPFHFNPIAWTVSVEWFLYLCFPLLALSIGKRAKSALCSLCLLGAALAGCAVYLAVMGFQLQYMNYNATSLLRGFFGFVIGMTLHNLYRLDFMKRLPWDRLALCAGMGFLLVIWLLSRHIAVYDMAFICLFTVLIYALANLRGLGLTLFSNRFAVHLGTVSYSFYMLHWFYLVYLVGYLPGWLYGSWFFSPSFIIGLLAMTGLASLSYRFIERPVNQWAHRRFKPA